MKDMKIMKGRGKRRGLILNFLNFKSFMPFMVKKFFVLKKKSKRY